MDSANETSPNTTLPGPTDAVNVETSAPSQTAPANPDPRLTYAENEEEEVNEPFDLIDAISKELLSVPPQRIPVHPSKIPEDLEGAESLNSLPSAPLHQAFSSAPTPLDGSGSGPITGPPSADSYLDEDGVHRSGNLWTASAHVITAVIGAGVLSLPYSMASLGWIAGPICFLLFAVITLYTAQLLADLYILDGRRQRTYTQMVATVFGRWGEISVAAVQQFNLVLTGLAYTITAATTMQLLANSACGAESVSAGTCFNSQWKMACIFGALQIVMSQLPNLERVWWVSVIGAVMSFGYAIIALILPWVYFDTHGTVGGISESSSAQKAWSVLNGIGAILFAYSFSFILLEIQDTIRTKKGARYGPITTMKKAVNLCVFVMTIFYVSIAVFNYLALGNEVSAFVLDSYPQAPSWVIDTANSMVLIHMIAAYQVWSQPHYEWVSDMVFGRDDEDEVDRQKRRNKLPRFITPLSVKLVYRSVYVCVLTFLAILMPFFNVILGLVGALGFWPATIFFPVECWIKVFKPKRKLKYCMRALDVFCFAVTVASIAGSVQQIVVSSSSMTLFGN